MSDAAREIGAPGFEGETFLEHVWTAGYDRTLSDKEIRGLAVSGFEAVRNTFDAIRGHQVPAGKTVRLTIKIETVDPDPEYHSTPDRGGPHR